MFMKRLMAQSLDCVKKSNLLSNGTLSEDMVEIGNAMTKPVSKQNDLRVCAVYGVHS